MGAGKSKSKIGIWIVAVIAVYMSFAGLGNVEFWDDEVETAWMSKSIIENGKPFAWNGRNIHDYGSGLYLNEKVESTFPPVSFITGALSFKMFGVSEGGGRTLFALMGVACLGVFLLLLRREVPNGGVRLAAFALFSLSPVYLLHIRTMRYFAPALLLTLLAFYFYRLYVTKHRPQNAFPWSIWAAAVCAGLLFFTHFVAALSLIIGLGICHLIFHATFRKPEWNLWLALGSLAAVCAWYLFSLGYITPDFEIRTNVFSIFYQEQNRLVRISSLLPLYLRFINIGGIAPWFVVVWVGWLAAKRLARKGAKNDRVPLFYGAVGLLITVSCAVISPQQEYDQYAATRFFFIAFPFFAVATAYFCLKIHSKSRIAGVALILLILNTTLFTWPFGIQNSPPLERSYRFTDLPAPVLQSVNIFSFESTYAQFPLPAMVREFHRDYPTFMDGLTEFFETNGKQDETIAIYPTWTYYNTLWYLDKKFLFCCVHSRAHALPPEVLNKYGVEIRAGNTPDWLVLSGPARLQTPGRILAYRMDGDPAVGTRFNFHFGGGTQYVLVKKLNSLFFPVWRPELFWHSFSPVKVSEDPRRGGVFIFRRAGN
ncbi:ArnT family glycosyltransferase [Candidatus Mycalebacterium sp.]